MTEEKLFTGEKKTARANTYAETMEALHQAESVLPDYTSSYDGEIQKLYEQIVNRPGFQYDPGADPLYRGYRDQMVTEGRLAMRDTIGEAASLTGGYGSSYAESVGQQQYGLYLQRLGAMMPELYKTAWERYRAEGDDLRDKLGAAQGMADREIGRKKERFEQAAALEQQSYDRRRDSYQSLVSVISKSGYSPSDAELAAAGMSRPEADALRQDYLLKNPMAYMLAYGWPAGGEVSGGGYSGGGSGGSSGGTSKPGPKEQMLLDASAKGKNTGGKARRN